MDGLTITAKIIVLAIVLIEMGGIAYSTNVILKFAIKKLIEKKVAKRDAESETVLAEELNSFKEIL